VDPRTATVAALFTQQAEKELTTTPVSTSLPDTGLMDNVGVPGLVALAASLVLVIILARRLRTGS
jgi:LPXTG-motif cell wall-anchored protein